MSSRSKSFIHIMSIKPPERLSISCSLLEWTRGCRTHIFSAEIDNCGRLGETAPPPPFCLSYEGRRSRVSSALARRATQSLNSVNLRQVGSPWSPVFAQCLSSYSSNQITSCSTVDVSQELCLSFRMDLFQLFWPSGDTRSWFPDTAVCWGSGSTHLVLMCLRCEALGGHFQTKPPRSLSVSSTEQSRSFPKSNHVLFFPERHRCSVAQPNQRNMDRKAFGVR